MKLPRPQVKQDIEDLKFVMSKLLKKYLQDKLVEDDEE